MVFLPISLDCKHLFTALTAIYTTGTHPENRRNPMSRERDNNETRASDTIVAYLHVERNSSNTRACYAVFDGAE